MPSIPFPTSTNPGSAPGEGSGRLVNCFAYKDGPATRWRPVPGLSTFLSLAGFGGEPRGARFDSVLLQVIGTSVLQIDAAAGVTQLEGSLPGDGPVTIARNNASPPTTTCVTNAGAFVIVDGVIKSYPGAGAADSETYANLPSVNSVAFLDGYFFWTTPDGRIFASDLNSTNVNALGFTSAEARADGLLRGVTYGQQYFALGPNTIEVYQDVGTLPFPLARSTVIPIGLLAPFAIAGFEDGWGGPLILVANDGSVRQLDGYTPTRISSEDLERLISAVDPVTDLRASVYTFGGNAIWSLSSPTWTWEYNITTNAWHERRSYGATRWRGGPTVKAFSSWMAPALDGSAIYRIDEDARTEAGDPLVWGMDSGAVREFPARIAVPAAAFDFTLGDEMDPNAAAPLVMLSWSHDSGAVWSNPIARSLGKQGRYRQRITVNRIGLTSAEGVRWRFRVSDPAYSSFAGGIMDEVVRR